MTMLRFRIGRIAILVFAFAVGASASARADGFVNPFVGYHFGADSACASVTNCDQKDVEIGISFGAVGPVLGFEVDLGNGNNFLGRAPNFESSVTTVMGNLLVAPQIAIVRPYVVGGLGLIHTHAALTGIDVPVTNDSALGWDLGGGLMIFFGTHVGVRGDLRAFKTLQDVTAFGFTLPDTRILFGRANIGVVFKF
jgi:hypothetical protein